MWWAGWVTTGEVLHYARYGCITGNGDCSRRVTTEVFFTHNRIAPSLGEIARHLCDFRCVDRLHRRTLFSWTVSSDWSDKAATKPVGSIEVASRSPGV